MKNRTLSNSYSDKPSQPKQLGLFDVPSLNVTAAIKEALNKDVKDSQFSREQVVDRMNRLADNYGIRLANGNGRRLTIDIFEKWLNPNDMSRQIPAKAIPVFCAATRRSTVVEALIAPIGLMVVGEREQKMLDWAEAKLAIKKHNQTARKLEAEF